MRGHFCRALVLALFTGVAPAQPCPSPADRAAVLAVIAPDKAVIGLDAATLQSLPQQQRSVRRSIAGAASAVEETARYEGVLLRDLLDRTLPGVLASRSARHLVIEAVATDGYIAVFSWGELFNSALGEQVLVVRGQDGRPLDVRAGPLALRSLADQRPGPRHVRNLCAVSVRSM